MLLYQVLVWAQARILAFLACVPHLRAVSTVSTDNAGPAVRRQCAADFEEGLLTLGHPCGTARAQRSNQQDSLRACLLVLSLTLGTFFCLGFLLGSSLTLLCQLVLVVGQGLLLYRLTFV